MSTQKENINYLKYTFFKVSREWRFLNQSSKQIAKKQFLEIIKNVPANVKLAFFSLFGTRADADFLIVAGSTTIDQFEGLISQVINSELGKYLDVTYSYLAVERKSPYFTRPKVEEISGPFSDRKYLFVYPFVKKREWYTLPFNERQKMMGEHFRIGSKYKGIKINTGYSFGLDDQEFVLAFEGNDPYEFLKLVEELRSSQASSYTQLETPIFTCIRTTPEKLIDLL